MSKIREIIRLHEAGISNRKISKALKVSRRTLAEYLNNYQLSGLKHEDISGMSDSVLLSHLTKDKRREVSEDRYATLSGYFEYYDKELKRTGVTRRILWEEYGRKHPDGYCYSKFCHHFHKWRSLSNVSMHMDHKAGDKMFIDYTGKKFKIIDPVTGDEKEVETFVSTLGASQFTYVEATYTQKKEDWINSNENALRYYGGSPKAIVPDCLKTGVTKANKYEPDINPEYADFAGFYDLVILPARPAHPKDKALVEAAVKNVYYQIYAPLRNRTFYSIEKLNEAIGEKLEDLNNKHFQRMKISRKDLFEDIEKKKLKPLPAVRYEMKKFLRVKVQFNYHVEVREDHHYYSVPWQYKGMKVVVIYTNSRVEIYHNNERIAFHRREKGVNKYTTKKEHMPPHHRFYKDWSPQKFINWGENVGENVKVVIERILKDKKYPEQGFKVCLGILNLSKKYGNRRLNNACDRAMTYHFYSYKKIKNILEKGIDLIEEESLFDFELPAHENIRGNHYFK